jgi:hypothetical protein
MKGTQRNTDTKTRHANTQASRGLISLPAKVMEGVHRQKAREKATCSRKPPLIFLKLRKLD